MLQLHLGLKDWICFAVNKMQSETTKPPNDADAYIYIDNNQRFQTILGFGGSFTDAAVVCLDSFS